VDVLRTINGGWLTLRVGVCMKNKVPKANNNVKRFLKIFFFFEKKPPLIFDWSMAAD